MEKKMNLIFESEIWLFISVFAMQVQELEIQMYDSTKGNLHILPNRVTCLPRPPVFGTEVR